MPSRRKAAGAALLLALASALLAPGHASAGRPFVVEEVELVGPRLLQLETWMLFARDRVTHDVMIGLGAGEHVEIKLGGVHGGSFGQGLNGYGLMGPRFEIDSMFFAPRDNGRPGLGLSAGVMSPLGLGAFEPPGWAAFGHAKITQSLFRERFFLHGSLGLSRGTRAEDVSPGVRDWVTGGAGMELRFSEVTRGHFEFFYRDPYQPYRRFSALQGGFSYTFNDSVALDGALGLILPFSTGDTRARVYGTVGVRLTTPVRWE